MDWKWLTERQTERQRKGGNEKNRVKKYWNWFAERETERQRNRGNGETETPRERETERQINIEADKWIDIKTEGQRDRKTNEIPCD
jgi:hypothetical protein